MTTVRALTLEEMPAYNKLCSICFTYTTSEEDLAPKEMSPEKLHEIQGVLDEDGTLLGAMTQISFDCRFEGHTTKLLGIGGVVTDPAERGRGAIRQLFEEGLPRLRSEGFVLSALYPFSHQFYRKFGYELGMVRRQAKFSPSSLRKDLYRAASIKRVLADGPDHGMPQVYEKYMQDKNLAVIRKEDYWKELRSGAPWKDYKHAYVLFDEAGEPIAYWVGKIEKGGDGNALTISDMAYTDRKGLEAILSMLRTMNEVGEVRLTEPQDVDLRYLTADCYDVNEQIECAGMVRVVDVEKALALLPAPVIPGRCVIQVEDQQIAENSGAFAVEGDGKTLTIVRTEDVPDVKCSINGLSAMVVGAMDFRGTVESRLAEMTSKENELFLTLLFPKRKQHMHNYF